MIVRTWRGRALASNPRAYIEHFHGSVLPELGRIPGFLGASLLRRDAGAMVEFLVLTRWESADAVRAFAGDDPGSAVVEPQAVAALIDYDTRVHHYEVVEEAVARR